MLSFGQMMMMMMMMMVMIGGDFYPEISGNDSVWHIFLTWVVEKPTTTKVMMLVQLDVCRGFLYGYYSPETNIGPENRPSQKESSIPTIHVCWIPHVFPDSSHLSVPAVGDSTMAPQRIRMRKQDTKRENRKALEQNSQEIKKHVRNKH